MNINNWWKNQKVNFEEQVNNYKQYNENGSLPSPAFDYTKSINDAQFLSSNWNDPVLNKIRELLNNKNVNHIWHNDYNHLIITTPDKVFRFSWYKNRGRTEIFEVLTSSEKFIKGTALDLFEIYEYFDNF